MRILHEFKHVYINKSDVFKYLKQVRTICKKTKHIITAKIAHIKPAYRVCANTST
jgi:hypothetical protein